MTLNPYACLTLLVVIVSVPLFSWFRRPSNVKHFPGPPGLPLVGNVLPSGRVWIKLHELGKEYGAIGIYSLKIFGRPMLVVNSARAARDLFDLRSVKYAQRPLTKIVEMAGFDRGVALEHDPMRLRLGRKVMRSAMQPRELESHTDTVDRHLTGFLKSLLHDPTDFAAHARFLTAAIMFLMSHGYDVKKRDDPFLHEANRLVENFARASNAGGYLVDWLPFLSVLPFPESWPGMGFKKDARVWREHYDQVANDTHQYVKNELASGTAYPSMTSNALSDTQSHIPSDVIKYSTAQTYTGGADTTASTISAFILMMVRHPEAQSTAQKEIDRVVGSDRLPTAADRPELPYVDAIFAEVLRMLPPISAVTREPDDDDMYQGYFIPRGTYMIENVWGMLHDENVYPEPFAFKPERWVDVKKGDFPDHPMNVAFGFGRRSCPGQVLADQLGFLALANILALFDISPALDDAGKAILPPVEQTDGSIIFPMPFKCTIRPRDHASRLLQDTLSAPRPVVY